MLERQPHIVPLGLKEREQIEIDILMTVLAPVVADTIAWGWSSQVVIAHGAMRTNLLGV